MLLSTLVALALLTLTPAQQIPPVANLEFESRAPLNPDELLEPECAYHCRAMFAECMGVNKAGTKEYLKPYCLIWTCAVGDTCPGCGWCWPEYNY